MLKTLPHFWCHLWTRFHLLTLPSNKQLATSRPRTIRRTSKETKKKSIVSPPSFFHIAFVLSPWPAWSLKMLSLTSAVVKTSPAASCPVAAASKLGPERSTIGLTGKDSKKIHGGQRKTLAAESSGKNRNQLNESLKDRMWYSSTYQDPFQHYFIWCFFWGAPLCLPSAKAASQTLQPGRDAVVVSHLSAMSDEWWMIIIVTDI